MSFRVGDIAVMKKKHPCGGDRFVICRTGADVRIKCEKCARFILLPTEEFERKVARVEKREDAGKEIPGHDA